MKGKIDPQIKKRTIHRLKIIEGKVRGLMKMVDKEKYCIDVLTQSLSIQESLKSFDALMLENHLRSHVSEQMKGKNIERAVSELVKIYKHAKK